MEIKTKYFEKYMYDIAVEQLIEDYLNKGYTVNKNFKVGNHQADIVAQKGEEVIVIEVKSGRMTPSKKETIAKLGNFVRSKENYKFLVAVATPPKEKRLDIANLESLLIREMTENFPSELEGLSTTTSIEDVNDIDIDEIEINGKSIYVKGDAVVSVELQYGSDGDQKNDDGYKTTDSFPFTFEITLKHNGQEELEIFEVDKLAVDTSTFYE